MKILGVGMDVVEVKRFSGFKKNQTDRFLNNFSQAELDYCFSFRDAATHLAGTFAAKEAVFKSLGQNGGKKIGQSEIEIRRKKNGSPSVWLRSKKQKNISVSISHTNKLAAAMAIRE